MSGLSDHIRAVVDAITGSAGRSDARLREQVCARVTATVEGGHSEAVPSNSLAPEVTAYVDTISRGAFRVTDEQVDGLRRAGLSEDDIFDLTVSAAVTAGVSRLNRALRFLEEEP